MWETPRDATPRAATAPPETLHLVPPAFFYLFLFLPYGAGGAFVAVTVGGLAGRAGVSDGDVAGLFAIWLMPHIWKFLWAPAIDWLGTQRGWHLAANVVASAGLGAMGIVPMGPQSLGVLRALALVAGVASTIVAMATESLVAERTPPTQLGRVAGWMQAGNAGGIAFGGTGLALAQRTGVPAATSLLAVVLLACSLPLAFVRFPPRRDAGEGLRKAARDLSSEVLSIVRSRSGQLGLVVCALPLGMGAAANLFAAISPDWRASPALVATSTGVASGVISVLGSLVGGRLSDSMPRRTAYIVAGLAVAAAAFAMAGLPRTPAAFVVSVLAYNFANGLVYATFAAFVLEIIGRGAAATKYNILAALANVPYLFVAYLDGWVSNHHGRTAMLVADGLSGVAGALVLAAVTYALRRRPA